MDDITCPKRAQQQCNNNTALCDWPMGPETQRVGTPHNLGLYVVSNSRPESYQWPPRQDNNKRWVQSPGFLRRGKGSAAFQCSPFCDKTPRHVTRRQTHSRISDQIQRYRYWGVPSGNCESVWERACAVTEEGSVSKEKEKLFFKCLKRKTNRYENINYLRKNRHIYLNGGGILSQ